MRNIIFMLIFSVLMLGCSISYAQKTTYDGAYSELKKTSLSPNVAEFNEYDDVETQILVYALIIGVYALYWFRQKA